MARIVVGSYMVRYPLGGMMSYVLQHLLGFSRLGHDVYFVEKAWYAGSYYDPTRDTMSDDCRYGVGAVNRLLETVGLQDRWCFVDAYGSYFGLTRTQIEDVFRTADVFVDMGTHGAWMAEATGGVRVLLEGEPGFTQMKMEKRLANGERLPEYDYYYSAGGNVGTARSSAPTAGCAWRHLRHPVVMDAWSEVPAPADAPFTTVMNWQSHDRFEFEGIEYGQKDLEFERFVGLPGMTKARMEVAVSGRRVPVQRLIAAGWQVRDAHAVTASVESFVDYIQCSRGEFSVCKQVFVATTTGWFSDRSAAYLASGRPVVLQDTGFASHLPVGHGLFAVKDAEEAAAAVDAVSGDYDNHAKWAREVASEYLDATKVLATFLDEIGIERHGRTIAAQHVSG
jgi:hypothetical protein